MMCASLSVPDELQLYSRPALPVAFSCMVSPLIATVEEADICTTGLAYTSTLTVTILSQLVVERVSLNRPLAL